MVVQAYARYAELLQAPLVVGAAGCIFFCADGEGGELCLALLDYLGGDVGGAVQVADYALGIRILYREVQLDLTPEIEVFHILSERCYSQNTSKGSIRQNT